MKRIIWMLSLLLVASATLTSCLGSNDDNTISIYPDMAVTSFTLGTLNRYQHRTSASTGNDTIVKISYTGSLYPMTIDQIGQRIYNETPLPIGTDAKHVICTIGTKNNGVPYLKSLTNDSLYYHQSQDSVDLSQPRILRIFAIDGSGSRDYTVTLNVSTTTGTTFGWVKCDSLEAVDNLADKQLLAFGDSIWLTDRGIVTLADRAFRLKDGLVEGSSDLTNWAPQEGATPAGQQLKSLIGASSFELFALGTDGRIKRSTDTGLSWQDEQLDEPATLLPQDNIAMVNWPYAPADNHDYVLMVGNDADNDARMSIWRKISPYTQQGQWVLMPQDEKILYKLPRLQQLSLACYDGNVVAMGGTDMKIYQSRDQGITWQQPDELALPASVKGTAAVMGADRQGRLWLFTNLGQLWRGSKL